MAGKVQQVSLSDRVYAEKIPHPTTVSNWLNRFNNNYFFARAQRVLWADEVQYTLQFGIKEKDLIMSRVYSAALINMLTWLERTDESFTCNFSSRSAVVSCASLDLYSNNTVHEAAQRVSNSVKYRDLLILNSLVLFLPQRYWRDMISAGPCVTVAGLITCAMSLGVEVEFD